MKEKIAKFFQSAFSESNGSVSASRCLAGGCVASTIIWISFIVFTQRHLPDLGGASMFVTAGFSGYGVNKISRALTNDCTKDKEN